MEKIIYFIDCVDNKNVSKRLSRLGFEILNVTENGISFIFKKGDGIKFIKWLRKFFSTGEIELDMLDWSDNYPEAMKEYKLK